MSKVLVLVGPTSSGKTSVALELCKKHNAEIISADSRQVYKYMDIGTGKIPLDSNIKFVREKDYWTFGDIKIHGYDLVTPAEIYSAYDFATFARQKINQILQLNKNVILVGGTGFFVDVTTGLKVLDSSAPDFELREKLEGQSLEDLVAQLSNKAGVDIKNKIRVLRALEKQLVTNKAQKLVDISHLDFDFYGLFASNEVLFKRADNWAEIIWQNGLLAETAFLKKNFPTSYKLKGLIYKTVVEHLDEKLNGQEALQRIKWDLHAYIRRQLTWFRKNSRIKWLNIEDIPREKCIIELEQTWIKK